MARHFNPIPPEVSRFVDAAQEFYDDEIEDANKVQASSGPKSMDDFRSSNLMAESFCISARVKAKGAVTARTQACLHWPVQTGYSCFLRSMKHFLISNFY